MAKLSNTDREKILADWKAGVSQNQLSKRYDVSPATINKLCKGIEQSNIDLVNTQISLLTALQGKSEYEVNSITSEVNTALRRANLVYGIQEKALQKAGIMLDQIDSPSDLKTIIDAVDKASITLKVAERHAPKGDINVNATANAANVNYESDYLKAIQGEISEH